MNIHGIPYIVSESDKKKDYCNMAKIHVYREPLQRGPAGGRCVVQHLGWGPAAQPCSASKTISTTPKRPRVAWYPHRGRVHHKHPSLRRESQGSVPSGTSTRGCLSLRACHMRQDIPARHLPSPTLVSLPLPEPRLDLSSHRRGSGGLPLSSKAVSAACPLLEEPGNDSAQSPTVFEQLYFQALLWISP